MNRLLNAVTRPLQTLLRLPLKLLAAPRKMVGLSLPTRVAVIVGILTIAVILFVFFVVINPGDRSGYLPHLAIALILGIAIPFAVRWAILLWLEGPTSIYPEIDKAWKAGLQALAEQSLDPADIPIYLVHGIPDEQQANFLFQASQERFSVNGVPDGRAELHWYASQEAIFLVCMCQSQLAALATAMPSTGTPQHAARSMRDTLRGTIEAMELQELQESPQAASASLGEQDALRGTLTPEADAADEICLSAPATVVSRRVAGPEMTAKLQYVCRLLQRLRQPACPINGILTVLPLDLVQDPSVDQAQVQQTMRGDLEAIRESCQLRCPAVTLITGMEDEVGFRELVRRVGHDVAKNRRFGKGFRVWNTPSPEQLEAVAAHACVAFDIMAYKLFRETDGLLKPGNPKLYSLICKVRTELRERLENVLIGAYGHGTSPENAVEREPLLFAGCYFASTGERPDLQAFVRGVFALLNESQDDLQWTQEARQENAFYERLAHLGFAVDGLLLIAIAGFLIYRFALP